MNSISGVVGVGADPMQTALIGIDRGLAGLARDANQVAQALVPSPASGASSDQLTNALVDSLQQRLLIAASADMLSSGNQALGTLIDVTA